MRSNELQPIPATPGRRPGHTVSGVTSAAEAINALRETPVCAVIADQCSRELQARNSFCATCDPDVSEHLSSSLLANAACLMRGR
jgi:hypothetical protein